MAILAIFPVHMNKEPKNNSSAPFFVRFCPMRRDICSS